MHKLCHNTGMYVWLLWSALLIYGRKWFSANTTSDYI